MIYFPILTAVCIVVILVLIVSLLKLKKQRDAEKMRADIEELKAIRNAEIAVKYRKDAHEFAQKLQSKNNNHGINK